MLLTSIAVVRELKKAGTKEWATAARWFFKTGKGQYGHGDTFVGVTVPNQRIIARRFADLPLAEIEKLLASPIHECRLTALVILVRQYQRADTTTKSAIARFYLKHLSRVNNWDLVDSSAPYILGPHLIERNRAVLYKLVRSRNLWNRRVAVIATFAFIRNDDYADALKLAELLLGDTHDLIHKAVGWMLREIGKRSLVVEERFLDTHAARMPRTMLRYAIERFPKSKRTTYLAMELRR